MGIYRPFVPNPRFCWSVEVKTHRILIWLGNVECISMWMYGKWVLARSRISVMVETPSNHNLAVNSVFKTFSDLPLHSRLRICLPMHCPSWPSSYWLPSQATLPLSSNPRDLTLVPQAYRVPLTLRHSLSAMYPSLGGMCIHLGSQLKCPLYKEGFPNRAIQSSSHFFISSERSLFFLSLLSDFIFLYLSYLPAFTCPH